LQDNSIDTDIDSIKALMDRIKNAIAPEMKAMIESLTSADSNIGNCRDLLDVYKVAHMLNKTVEELQAAIRENDRLEAAIAQQDKTLTPRARRNVRWNSKSSSRKKRLVSSMP
jgi:hypothetical protein